MSPLIINQTNNSHTTHTHTHTHTHPSTPQPLTPPTQYADEFGETVCNPCIQFGSGVNWIQPAAGSNHCDRCAAGLVANSDFTECETCHQGKYVNDNSPSCLPCPPGKTTNDEVGYVECSLCPAGTESEDHVNPAVDSMNSIQECIPCVAGYFSSAGVATCTPCAPGDFADDAGNPYCFECPAGKKGNSASDTFLASTGCTNCASGTYSTTGSFACPSCVVAHPAGGYTSVATEQVRDFFLVVEFSLIVHAHDPDLDRP